MKIGRPFLAVCFASLSFSLPLYAATVHGQLLGPGSKPVTSATILIFARDMTKPAIVKSGVDGNWIATVPDLKNAATPQVRAGTTEDVNFVAALVIAPHIGFAAKLGNRQTPFDITLPASSTIGGVVQDEKGSLQPNVKVRVLGFYSSDFSGNGGEIPIPFDAFGAGLAPVLTAQSDAQGKWQLDGIPQGMRVFVSVDDARFSTNKVDVRSNATDAIVKATPGAVITGRVIAPDGKPAAGIQVFCNSQRAKTDAYGRFSLVGLPLGNASIALMDEKKEWVPTSKQVANLTSGETRDLGNLTLSKGIVLTGKVVDETGKPIAGATVRGVGTDATTRADGTFQTRVSAGNTWVNVSKDGYLNIGGNGSETLMELKIPPGETTHAIDALKLQRGVYVTGTAFDTAGKPAANVILGGDPNSPNPASATVQKDGRFRFGPLFPGKKASISASDAWELTKQVTFTAPTVAAESKTPRLALVLKKIELVPVKARVVSTDGVPVVGVKIGYRIYLGSKHDSWSNGEATSDDKGQLSFGRLRPEQSPGYDSVKSDSYAYVKSAIPAREAHVWNMGDIVVSPLDGVVKGRVLNATGAPAAGAKIIMTGRYPFKVVVAGDDGSFTLDKLPRAPLTILAAKDHGFVRQSVTPGQETDLKLDERPTPTKGDGNKLLVERGSRISVDQLVPILPLLDPDFALSLLKKSANGQPNPDAVAELITSLARTDPKTASTWGMEQWTKLPPANQSIESGTALALAVLPTNRKFAEAWFIEARSKIGPKDFSADAADKYFLLAGLAGALGNKEAGTLVEYGLTASDQSVLGDNRLESAPSWGGSVAANVKLAIQLAENLDPIERVGALAGAIKALAPRDPDGAAALLARLIAASKDPQIKAADKKQEAARQNGGDWHRTSDENISVARSAIAMALASRPGPAALDMAKQISDEYRRNSVLLKLARHQLVAGRSAEAAATIQEFDKSTDHYDTNSAAGASIELNFDKAMAQAMFQKEYSRLFDNSNEDSNDYRSSAAGYAFYHAPLDPAESRLILENEWDWRLAVQAKRATNKQTANQGDNQEWQMRPIATAMGALDLPRALEMLAQMKDQYHQNDQVTAMIGLYLTTDGKCDLFGLDRDNEDY